MFLIFHSLLARFTLFTSNIPALSMPLTVLRLLPLPSPYTKLAQHLPGTELVSCHVTCRYSPIDQHGREPNLISTFRPGGDVLLRAPPPKRPVPPGRWTVHSESVGAGKVRQRWTRVLQSFTQQISRKPGFRSDQTAAVLVGTDELWTLNQKKDRPMRRGQARYNEDDMWRSIPTWLLSFYGPKCNPF